MFPICPPDELPELERHFNLKLKGADFHVQAKYYENACPKHKISEFQRETYLGKGGFARVYKSRTTAIAGHPYVAVKVQLMEGVSPARAIQEKKLMYAMDMTCVLKAMGCFRDQVNCYLYVEYASHGSLKRVIDTRPSDVITRYYIGQLVLALEYTHAARLIHGDVKPDNVMVFKGGRLKLGDYGLSIFHDDNIKPARGTLYYMAPEILFGGSYTDAVDWWALGIITCQFLMGRSPFETKGEYDADKIYTRDLEDLHLAPINPEATLLLTGLLEDKPTERFGTLASGLDCIKKHGWFHGFNLVELLHPTFSVPYFNLAEFAGEDVQGKREFSEHAESRTGSAFDEF